MSDVKSDPKKPAVAAEAHHVRARIFALDFLLGMRVTLSNLTADAKELEGYILGKAAKASPEEVDARIQAIRCAARGNISRANLVKEARVFEKYILTGEARAKPAVPVTAGKDPADDPASVGSTVPGAPGEASEIRPQGGRPSSRPELGREVDA